MKTEKATFAAGCFWGVQEAFSNIEGVVSTMAGYTGGFFDNPHYGDVCSGKTGHAEAVEVIFNPEKVSYQNLLDVFWKIHNPTTLNRQGPDVGDQYRSAIFYHSEEQNETAIKSKEKVQKMYMEKRVVTEISEAGKFYPAEEYHQNYIKKTGVKSCHIEN